MGLRLNGSTSGYIEINATATAPSTSIEIPKLGFGKILQVKHAYSTTDVNNITSNTLLLSVSLTPLSSTSKVLVWGHCYCYVINSGNGIAVTKLEAHTSAATGGTQIADANFGSDNNQTCYATLTPMAVHSPGSTNTVYYNLIQGKGSVNTSRVDAFDYAIYAMEVES